MSVQKVPLLDLADLEVWRDLQLRLMEVTALRLGLWDEDAKRVLPPPMPPPACQYVLSEPDRRERCEQFHGSVRAEVRRRGRPSCKTCPFGVEYLAVPLAGAGCWAGHWEGGYVITPGPPVPPDPLLDEQTWFSAQAVTPHRTHGEIESAVQLIGLLHEPLLRALSLRERRRDQVAQLAAFELGRTLDVSRSLVDTLTRCLELATQVLGAPLAVLYLLDVSRNELVPAASAVPEGIRGPRGSAIEAVGQVRTSGQGLLVQDLRDRPDLGAPFEKARSLVAVPIQVEGANVGVLELASYAPNAFVPDDLGLVSRFAELAQGVLSRDLRTELSDPTSPSDAVLTLLDAAFGPERARLS